MAQQTAIQEHIKWMEEVIEISKAQELTPCLARAIEYCIDGAKAKLEMEKEQIINAIMYALDEDGHTGDWKIKFANDYYEALNKGYDIRNKNVQREFGGKAI
jgi:predicted metal-dependent hydrolase